VAPPPPSQPSPLDLLSGALPPGRYAPAMTTDHPNGSSAQPALRYERRPLTDLQLDPRNARAHDRANIDAIKESLERFGQRLPVVVRHGQLVGGNATTIAADELGWTHLDVVVSDDLSEEEARRLAIMLNRSAELAAWDQPVLIESLQGLDDLAGTGFSLEQLVALEALANPEPFDPNAEWQGMPDYDSDYLGSAFHVIVHFRSDQDAAAFFQLIGKPRQKSLWWPEPDGHKGTDTHAAYVADESP
jgi:hypothetical protein